MSKRPNSWVLTVLTLALGLQASSLAARQDTAAQLAQKKGATRLEPIAPWNIDFGENRCRLTRLFGDPEKPHLVMIEQTAPTSQFGLTLAGPHLRKFPMGSWTYFGILKDQPVQALSGHQRGEVDKIGKALIFGTIAIDGDQADQGESTILIEPGIDLEQAARIENMVLKLGTTVVSFETGGMMPPMQALNVCSRDLLATWGLSPESHERYQPTRWINREAIAKRIGERYPKAAMYAGEQGIMRLRVIVELDGTVSDCHIEASTEQAKLQSPACEEMDNARFDPALDSKGEPIRSFHAETIVYSAYPSAG